MTDFYHKLPTALKNQRQFGQICWVPAPIVSRSTIAMRLPTLKAGADVTKEQFSVFKLKPEEIGHLSEQDKVNVRSKMPIPELGLARSEELTVVKVKVRPAVLIHHDCLNWRKEAKALAEKLGKPQEPERHLFAPVFSLAKENDAEAGYPAEFIEHVKNGDYPNILFLPAYSAEIVNDSMVILCDVFQAGLYSFRSTDLCVDPLTLAAKIADWADYLATEGTDLDELLAKGP